MDLAVCPGVPDLYVGWLWASPGRGARWVGWGAQPLSSAANMENNQTHMYECGPCSRSRVSRTLWAGHCITSCELESLGIKFSPGAGDWLGRVVGLALISVGSRG